MAIDFSRLLPLGWSPFHSSQLSLEQLDTVRPARVVQVGRGRYRVHDGTDVWTAVLSGRLQRESSDLPTVGDWVLLAAGHAVIVARLERRTLIARREAGGAAAQAIAANIDLMVIVSGLDAGFNLHRIERYLVLAAQADVTSLVLLTKSDLVADPGAAIAQVRTRLPATAEVLAVNALRDPLVERLAPWLGMGNTLVVVGSSGVGKSTVVNNLAGHAAQATGTTRRDAKGRHTTTARVLIRLAGGACIIDVPGMREVGLAGEGGVARQFGSIAALAAGCRFADCTHGTEPGCAVRAAVERGDVEADAWMHYLKLSQEERQSIPEHERRRRGRVFGRMVRKALATKEKNR